MTDQPAGMITINTEDGPMPAQLRRPAAGIGPGVVLVHEIFGMSDSVRDRGRDLVGLSHVRGMIEVEGGVGLLGCCFGGGLAFNVPRWTTSTSRSATTARLGNLLDPAGDVQTPSLHPFGLADAFIPAETIAAIQAAVAEHGAQFETYEGANHALTTRPRPFITPKRPPGRGELLHVS